MPGRALPDARELRSLWNGILGTLRLDLTLHQYQSWLADTTPHAIEGDLLTIEAKTDFACNWIEQHLAEPIAAMASDRLGAPTQLRFRPRMAPDGGLPLEHALQSTPATVIGTVNCDYTFETYVVGDGNRGAFEGASGLSAGAAWTLGPVFLWGPPGMGKTHLLHAAACRAIAAGSTVTCLPGNQLVDRYMDALRRERVGDFQRELREARLLVIDDLQYLAGRKGILDELQHAIDAVTNAGGRVLIGSEQHPLDLGLNDRLAGRLSAGVVERITPLARPEREALARRAAARAGVELPTWAIERISSLDVSCVRSLLGGVNAAIHLERTGQLDLARIDLTLARLAMSSVGARVSDADLIEQLASHFMFDASAIRGRDTHKAIADARAVTAAALCTRGRSLAEAGALLDGRDKGTISGLVKRGKRLIEADPRLAALLAG